MSLPRTARAGNRRATRPHKGGHDASRRGPRDRHPADGGTSRYDWTAFARTLQDAGAAAVEGNCYNMPGGIREPGRDVEARCADVVYALKHALDVPVAVKLPPYFSSFAERALRLVGTGADGLVRFNRFLLPQIDVQTLTVAPVIGLSHSSDARLPQTWIALLREQLTASLAGTSGVETASDLIAYLLAGADVVECASAFLRNGIHYASSLLDGVDQWGNERGFGSVEEISGRLAVPWNVDAEDYTREGYVAALQNARRSYARP